MNDDDTPDDLAERLDLSFGDGPVHRPLEHTLARGRRRLVRRRLASGVAAVAVAGVMATSFALLAGGSQPSAGVDPATSTSPDPAPVDCEELLAQGGPEWYTTWPDGSTSSSGSGTAPVEELTPAPAPEGIPEECLDLVGVATTGTSTSGSISQYDGRADTGEHVDLDADGHLHRAAGVTIEERVDNPLGWDAPDRSAAVEYVVDDQTNWAVLTFQDLGDDCGSWSSTVGAPVDGQTLTEWAVAQVGETSLGDCAVPAPAVETKPSR